MIPSNSRSKSLPLFGLALVAVCAPAVAEQTEQHLYTFDVPIAEHTLRISEDGERIAYVEAGDIVEDEFRRFILDGELQGEHVTIRHAVVSDDGRRVAYVASSSTEWCEPAPSDECAWQIIADGEPGSRHSLAVLPSFSPNGECVAYIAGDAEDQQYVVIDGEQGKTYRFIRWRNQQGYGSWITFSDAGCNYAYAARTPDTKMLVVRDGVEGSKYDEVDLPVLSPDGKTLAYFARKGKEWRMVVNGAEHAGRYERIGVPVFSPNSQRLAYRASTGTSRFYKRRWEMVIDGKPGKTFEDMHTPVFSADSKHVWYVAEKGDDWRVFVDEERRKPKYDYIHGSPVISTDGTRGAFVAIEYSPRREFVVVDGAAQEKYDAVRSPVFSPNGKHIAYLAQRGKTWTVVIDGIEGEWQPGGIELEIDDEKTYVVYARRGDDVQSQEVRLDSAIGEGVPDITQLTFNDDGDLTYLRVRDEGNLYRVVVPLGD